MRLIVSLTLFAALAGADSLCADDKKATPQLEALQKQIDDLKKKFAESEKYRVSLEDELKLFDAVARERQSEFPIVDVNSLWLEHKQEMKGLGKRVVPRAPLPRVVYQQPVLPSRLRGNVMSFYTDFLLVDIGLDAGLAVGTTLDLYRTEGEKPPQLLGKVKVTGANNLYPKQAIVKFTPARDVAFDKLKPEELPRKGDMVRPPASQPE